MNNKRLFQLNILVKVLNMASIGELAVMRADNFNENVHFKNYTI